jgi:hypothetical protein
MGQSVDRDPLGRLAGGAAHQLPGPLRVRGQEPFQVPHAEPADVAVAVADQATHDVEQRARRAVPGAALEGLVRGLHQRQANADDLAKPGGDAA